MDIPIVYQDAALLVINKPAGLSTLPDGYDPSLPHIKSLLEQQYGRLWIVHRLDKETSGVLLLTRSAEAHRVLNNQFDKHLTSKVYHALVIGNPAWDEKTVSVPLRPNGDRLHRTVADLREGKPALTHFKVLEQLGVYALLEAVPETGRTHQIRAHLATLSLYLIGDKLYSRRADSQAAIKARQLQMGNQPSHRLSDGMGLHAISLEIDHPLTGERMKFSAAYPEALARILEELRSSSTVL